MRRRLPCFATALSLTLTLLVGSTLVEAAAIPSYKYTSDASMVGGAGTHSIMLLSDPLVQTTDSGTYNLGTFTTNPLLPGETATYKETPFSIDLRVYANDPSAPSGTGPMLGEYQIGGFLNGSIASDGTSTLFPSIRSITTSAGAPFPSDTLSSNLPLIAAPQGSTAGVTPLTVSVAYDSSGHPLPAPAPEPTSVAIFAASLLGLAWHRRRVSR